MVSSLEGCQKRCRFVDLWGGFVGLFWFGVFFFFFIVKVTGLTAKEKLSEKTL